jgi:L-alanine-DL-glutamate epimerase-like enolase superfamily enzyme
MTVTALRAGQVEGVEVSAYSVPTDEPESDGTLSWNETTLVLVEARAEAVSGLGFCYANLAAAELVESLLAETVVGRDIMDVAGSWNAMVARIRNQGRPGIASMAISAVDAALWDLKARLLETPLALLLGRVRNGVLAYGSGGFTSYSLERLQQQLGSWVESGIPRVKMKVGRCPDQDVERVKAAREAIGAETELYVDANGAFDRKQALAFGERFAALGVSWFEEPVSSDDLTGLRLLRDRLPGGMEVSAGEYGYDLPYFRRMLEAGAADVLQADVTRCGGITGFLGVGALCEAFGVPLSAHTAPALSVQVGVAVQPVRHVEYFHDHVRVERMLFEGTSEPHQGRLEPDTSRPGNGLELKRQDAQQFLVWRAA